MFMLIQDFKIIYLNHAECNKYPVEKVFAQKTCKIAFRE